MLFIGFIRFVGLSLGVINKTQWAAFRLVDPASGPLQVLGF